MLSNTWIYLQWTLTKSDTSVSISNDNWWDVASFTGESVVLISADGKTFEQGVATASAGTLTFSKRGLTKSKTQTESAGLKKEWRAGTQVYITALAPDYIIGNSANTWTGKQTFTDVDVIGVLNMWNVSDINVIWKSNPQPNFADTIARDAIYTAPLDWDKCTVAWTSQTYNGSTVQWESYGVSTPLPQATEVIVGKTRYATTLEASTGTDDATAMTPLKTKTLIAQSESALSNSDYIAGETMIQWDSMFPETAPTFAQATSIANIWDVSANTRYAFPIFGNGISMWSLKLWLKKFVSPSVDLKLRIESETSGSPSGTILAGTSEYTIASSGLTTSIVDIPVLLWTQSAQAHWVTLNVNETSQTVYKWVKITLTSQTGVISVDKVAGCTATKAYLYDIAGNLLTSASFSTNTATFTYGNIVNWQSYYILVGSDWSSYTSIKQTGSTSFPYVSTKINYTNWSLLGSEWLVVDSWFTGTSWSAYWWNMLFTATKGSYLKSITWIPWVFNSCWLYTEWWVLIENLTLSSWTATFSWWYKLLVSWTQYRLIFWLANINTPIWFSYNGAVNVIWTNITVNNVNNWTYTNLTSCTINFYYAIEDTNINNITSIIVNNTIVIPDGQKSRWVLYAGTYGSETVNWTNYFGVAYSTNDTTTRGSKVWNGSVYSAVRSAINTYISWTGIQSTVLSKTDADFTYKLPSGVYRLATKAYNAGELVKYDFKGISKTHPEVVAWQTYYTSNTPWQLSTSPWTNSNTVGTGIYTGQLLIA